MTTKKTGEDGRSERRLGDKPEYLRVLIGEGNWSIHTMDFAYQAEPWDASVDTEDEGNEESEENDNE